MSSHNKIFSYRKYSRNGKIVNLPDSMTFRYIPELEMIAVRNYGRQRDTRWNGFVPDELKTSEETAKKRVEERGTWLNRMRHATRTKFRYGHAFRDWQKRFLATHPEYFGLNPYGKRGLPPAQEKLVKLCLSNPAVVDRIIADWKAKGTPKYLNVCPNDGTPGYCFCANCIKLDADLPGERFHSHKTDRYLYFWNKVAEKAVAIRPDVTIVTYIYSYYRFPPRREKIAYPDNMLFGLVPSMPDNLDEFFSGWAKAGEKHCFFRPNYLHYTGVLPRGLEKFFYDVFQTARKTGADGGGL